MVGLPARLDSRDEAQRGGDAGPVACAGERGEHALDGVADADGGGRSGRDRECRAEAEEEWA